MNIALVGRDESTFLEYRLIEVFVTRVKFSTAHLQPAHFIHNTEMFLHSLGGSV